MNCSGKPDSFCGGGAGASVQTPQRASNLPGLPAVAYRTGDWAAFKSSLLARLSSADYPALAALKTRANDDFTVAFLDATATMLDILTFYTERLANESYLRTAQQARSLTELCRLIGYQPAPAVSAATWLAFTLRTAPGQPVNPSTPTITIPKGTQAQSVPAQGQVPQTFETAADIPAKSDWNALTVRSTRSWAPQKGDTSLWLQGVATQLHPGDALLIVGDERANAATTQTGWDAWALRLVLKVEPDPKRNRTRVTWKEPLGLTRGGSPARQNPKLYALRQRAALFGYNAVDPKLLAQATIDFLSNPPSAPAFIQNNDWVFEDLPAANAGLIKLEATYARTAPGGWIALVRPDNQANRWPAELVSLYKTTAVATIACSQFGLSAKISQVTGDTSANLAGYYAARRHSSVLVQSEELAAAEQPLPCPLYGTVVDLNELRPDLANATAIAITGKRQKLLLTPGASSFSFAPAGGASPTNLKAGDVLTLIGPGSLPLRKDGRPPEWDTHSAAQPLEVEDAAGRPGTVTAPLNQFALLPAESRDSVISEIALVQSVSSITATQGRPAHTRITLQNALANCYDRSATTVNANVAPASHGQSVSEMMGGGNARTANQQFTLKQSPLTFVQAPVSSGRQSTLEVRVNAVAWDEVPSLYAQAPVARVFTTLNQADGTTDVRFGDGVEGATLPTGQNNLQANYRIGAGAGGNVAAGTLTTLLDRPLGVSGVTNPQAATGGQDAQPPGDIRAHAPRSLLTLGRAVSLADYEACAASFAGIAKAHAAWIASGPGRGVFLTVAGIDGAVLPPGCPTLTNLVASLGANGNPLIPITAVSFVETLFGLSADLAYAPAYDPVTVRAQVRAALSAAFSFAARNFGQDVSADEIAAVIQAVPGIIGVRVSAVTRGETSGEGDISRGARPLSLARWRAWKAGSGQRRQWHFPDSAKLLHARWPIASMTAMPGPAEILVLNPDPSQVQLGVMS